MKKTSVHSIQKARNTRRDWQVFDFFYYDYAGFFKNRLIGGQPCVKRTFAIRPGEKVAKLVKRMHYVSFVGMLRSDLFEEKLAKDKMLRAVSNVVYAKDDYEKEMEQAALKKEAIKRDVIR